MLYSKSTFYSGCITIAKLLLRGYNVTIMTIITTKLIKDGNSIAVRIPKTVLMMSGLHDDVQMEVSNGRITLTAARIPRAGWKEQIELVLATNPSALSPDPDLDIWDGVVGDGID